MSKRPQTYDFALRWSESAGRVLPRTRMDIVLYCSDKIGRRASLLLDEASYSNHKGERAAYLSSMRCLLYNLQTNPPLRGVDAGTLATMSDEEMRKGTVLQDIEQTEEDRRSRFEAMLQERNDSVETRHSNIRCRKCKRSNLAFEQKQTRGADEAMTVFLTCKDCGLNWKL